MDLGAALWRELVTGFPDNIEIARIAVRLLAATLLGGAWASNGPTSARRQGCGPTCWCRSALR